VRQAVNGKKKAKKRADTGAELLDDISTAVGL